MFCNALFYNHAVVNRDWGTETVASIVYSETFFTVKFHEIHMKLKYKQV